MSYRARNAAADIGENLKELLENLGYDPGTVDISWFQANAEDIIDETIDDALDDATPARDYDDGREEAFGEVEGMIADQLNRIELLHLDTDLSAAEVLRKIQDALGQISA